MAIVIIAVSVCMTACDNAGAQTGNETAAVTDEAAAEETDTKEDAEPTVIPTPTAAADDTKVATGSGTEVTPSVAVTGSGDETEEPTYDKEDIVAVEGDKVMYAQHSVNVRKGPGTDFEIVGRLAINDEIAVIGESKTTPWKEIRYKDSTAFVHGDYISTEQIDLEALKAAQEAAIATQAAAAQAAAEQAAAQAAAQAAPQPQPAVQEAPVQVASPVKTLFIGDSRTCQMQSVTGGGNCNWICEYAQSFEWFRDTAVVKADPLVGKGTRVVICMGVNDPNNINNYAAVTNQKAAEWTARGAAVYYVSINPVDHPYEDKTVPIDSFNATMPGLLSGVKWIDTASTVKQGGFVLEDGIHYDSAGNLTIFNMIYRNLR